MKPTRRYKPLYLAVLVALPGAAFASEAEAIAAQGVELDAIEVVAEALLDDAPPGETTAPVDNTKSIHDLFTDTPGVDFSSAGRGVLRDPVIRGIGGPADGYGTGAGRVPITVDGIALPTTYAFAHDNHNSPGAKGLNYFDAANIKSATISRGPTVSQAATGVGGVIALKTKDPEDILRDGRKVGLELQSGYDGRWDEKMINLSGAFRTDAGLSGLVSLTRREGKEAQTQPEFQEGIEPFSNETNDILTKWIWDMNADNRFTLSLGRFKSEKTINPTSCESIMERWENDSCGWGLLSLYRVPMREVRQEVSTNIYERRFATLAGKHTTFAPFADTVDWFVSTQKTKSDLLAHRQWITSLLAHTRGLGELKISETTGGSVNAFPTKRTQFGVTFAKAWQNGALEHSLQYGLNAQRESVHQKNSSYSRTQAWQANASNHQTADNTDGSASSYFPKTDRTYYSLYLSDRMTFGDTGFSLTPSLKYQYQHVKPDASTFDILTPGPSGFVEGYKEEKRDRSFDAAVLAHWQISPEQAVSLNLAQATRMPNYTEDSPASFYHAQYVPGIVASDIRSEKAQGVSLGWRLNRARFGHNLTLSTTHYKDMIVITRVPDPQDPTNRNQDKLWLRNEAGKTKIDAIEYGGYVNFGDWNLSTSLAWAKGKNTDTGKPVNFVAPFGGYAQLAYVRPKWDAFVKTHFSAAKKAKDISDTAVFGGTPEPVPGYATVDVGFKVRPSDRVEFSVTGHNMLNKRYMRWSDAVLSFGNDRREFWQPERAVSVGAKVKF